MRTPFIILIAFLGSLAMVPCALPQEEPSNPMERYEEIRLRISDNKGARQKEAILELFSLCEELGNTYQEKEDLDICLALLFSVMELEGMTVRGEGMGPISLLDLLELGRKSAIRYRQILDAKEVDDPTVKEGYYEWLSANEVIHLWEYARHLREAHRLDHAMRVLDEAAGLDVSFMMPWIHLRRASIERMRGNFSGCERWLELSNEKSGDVEQDYSTEFVAFLSWEFSLYYLDIGVPERAAWWFEKGKAASRDTSDPEVANQRFLHETTLLITLEQFYSAIQTAKKGLSYEGISPVTADQLRIRWALAREEQDRKERQCRLHALEAPAPLFFAKEKSDETEGNENSELSCPREELKGVLEAGRVPESEAHLAALLLARLALDEGKAKEADHWLSFADRSRVVDQGPAPVAGAFARSAFHSAMKARMLIETGAPIDCMKEALSDLHMEHVALLEQLSTMPIRKGGVGFLYYDDRRLTTAELIRMRLLVEEREPGALHAFNDLLAAQSLGSLARTMGVESTDLSEIRKMLLKNGNGILAYLPAPDRSYVFMIDADSIHAVELAPEQVLLQLRANLVRLIRQSQAAKTDPAIVEKAAENLSKRLLPDEVQDELETWEGVTVVGLDLLGWTPFECLPLNSGERVGMKMAVDWLPSLALGVHLAKQNGLDARNRAEKVLMLASPEVREVALPQPVPTDSIGVSRKQAARLKKAANVCPLEFLKGKHATEDRIVHGDLDDVHMLILLAHGIALKPVMEEGVEQSMTSTALERPAALLLVPTEQCDGILEPDEVEKIASPPLVVLSACRAAAGPIRYGDDGLNHLGGAFFQAGARTLLLTRARLEFESTVALTTRFIENVLKHDMTPAEALREARCLIAGQPGWSDPFYHSMLQVYGLGHATEQ